MDENIVSIFGTGRTRPGESAYVLGEDVGRALAQAGFAIANGGYRGTMHAAAKGAAEVGGTVIGVTCSAFKRSVANEFVTREVVTESLEERLHTLVEIGRAYVVLPGGTGTLLELAAVWELKNKGFLDPARPVILMGSFWKPVVDLVAADDPGCLRHIAFADTASQVVDLVKRALGLTQS